MTHFAGKAAKVLVLSAATTLLLAVSALAAEGDIAVGAGATTGSSLRMRAEASTSSSIITTLDKNVAVAVLDDTLDGWYKVSVDGKTGYMMAQYLKVTADVVSGTATVINPNGNSYVNFRSGASLNAGVLRTVPVGTTINVLEKTTDWTKAEIDGQVGYISTWFLRF